MEREDVIGIIMCFLFAALMIFGFASISAEAKDYPSDRPWMYLKK